MSVYHKPSGPVKLMNRFFGWLASIGLMPSDTVLLQVKGRKSGQTRSVAVTWVEHEGQRYLVAPRGNTEWVRNAKAAGGGDAGLAFPSRRLYAISQHPRRTPRDALRNLRYSHSRHRLVPPLECGRGA